LAEHAVIGVAVDAADLAVAREFFELFKTPWEVAVPGHRYPAVLSTIGRYEGFESPVVFVYGSAHQSLDDEMHVSLDWTHSGEVACGDQRIPIYGRVAMFEGGARGLTAQGKSVQYEARLATRVVRRIGYDLFQEVRHLLTIGQPASHALIPTLDLHVEMLRNLLVDCGVPFLEVPPRPAGYDFTCCLTHDIDFYGIRRHGLDRTLAGFLLRASIGSVADVVHSRRTVGDALRNFGAVCSLPLVFTGLLPDFWRPFDDYAAVEDPRRSTFFLLPFRGRPGQSPTGSTDATRAVQYQASEIAEDVRAAIARGSEIGLHGIDAWRADDAGRSEMREITSLTARENTGVRMHWLYFSEQSPRLLETAGFEYDSTWGYNDAVGYRAGTSQVFGFPGTTRLLELPLSIMDTALFAWDRWAMTRADAWQQCDIVLDHATRAGGTVVINWHCRSLAPERLWGTFYKELLLRLADRNRTWFATAGHAVDWFRWRRSIAFRETSVDGASQIQVTAGRPAPVGGTIRVNVPIDGQVKVEDRPFDGSAPVMFDLLEKSLAPAAHAELPFCT
jgi:hypothetical protein